MSEDSFQATLDDDAWRRLIQTVFEPSPDEHHLALLVDLPDANRPDNEAWRDRRKLALAWWQALSKALGASWTVELFYYPNAGTNNGDLPPEAWPHDREIERTGQLPEAGGKPFTEIFDQIPLLIAMSELSATAPLKVAAKRHGFRAATMPRFSPAMMPALALDLAEVDRRCQLIKSCLDRAEMAEFVFRAEGLEYELQLDLRHRTAHASSGLLRTPGLAGNLPSGETYIVPYEGEKDGLPSSSGGFLPVAFDGPTGAEIVIYEIGDNKAMAVDGEGPTAATESRRIVDEPAYANLAELGLGVLGDLGIEPIGEILLDEKLGLHIAFGRSDHFGGTVGPADFTSPDAVVHIDRVYLPGGAVQPLRVDLIDGKGRRVGLMREGRYRIDFTASAEEVWT